MITKDWIEGKINEIIKNSQQESVVESRRNSYAYDVFISHASADKPMFVSDLYVGLIGLGATVWYDQASIEWGDDWQKRIDEGLEKCRFGIVILSANFFNREWTEYELRRLLARQSDMNDKLILPILYGVDINYVRQQYPILSSIQMLTYDWNVGKDSAIQKIVIAFARVLLSSVRKNGDAKPIAQSVYDPYAMDELARQIELDTRNKLKKFRKEVASGEGVASFDFLGNDGSFVIASGDAEFVTKWSECGSESVYAYRDSVKLIGVSDDIHYLPDSPDEFRSLDWTRRASSVKVGDIVVFVNRDHRFLGVKILSVSCKSRGSSKNELQIQFKVY